MANDPSVRPVPEPLGRTKTKPDSFTEVPAWQTVGTGWKHLHGGFRELGFSLEWHDFAPSLDLDWSRSFHPNSLEICLNLAGHGEVRAGSEILFLAPQTAGFYYQMSPSLKACRRAKDRHQFITLELSRDFVSRHVASNEPNLHPQLARFVAEERVECCVSQAAPLSSDLRALVMSLRKPPVFASAQRLWFYGKALEIASAFFYQAPPDKVLFCEQQKQINQERAKRVIAILKENIAEPPSLDEIARRVGCSSFHLSRIFTQQLGYTMTQCLRQLRMERAAELLLEGQLKITSVALEVGYSSPSHFSTAFHETFGCCPGLYPLRTVPKKESPPNS